jgi:hypothetical protein
MQLSVCRADVTNAAGISLDVPCVPNDLDGVLTVAYNLTAAGGYTLTVYLAENKTSALGKLGKREITVRAAAPVAAACTVAGVRNDSAAFEAVSVVLTPRDGFGNRLTGAGIVFEVFAAGPSGVKVPSTTPVYAEGTAEYHTTYGGGEGGARGLTVPGPHTISITLGGVHVAGSPFAITVRPAATSASRSVVSLPASSTGGDFLAATAGET